MKNLKRYEPTFTPRVMRRINPIGNEGYIKFSAIEEALRSASDNNERLAIALWKRTVEIAEENHPVDVSLGMLTVLIDEWRSATAPFCHRCLAKD